MVLPKASAAPIAYTDCSICEKQKEQLESLEMGTFEQLHPEQLSSFKLQRLPRVCRCFYLNIRRSKLIQQPQHLRNYVFVKATKTTKYMRWRLCALHRNTTLTNDELTGQTHGQESSQQISHPDQDCMNALRQSNLKHSSRIVHQPV